MDHDRDQPARQVEAMAAYGIPEKEIARVLGIDAGVLRSRFADVLDTAQTKANSRVAESLYRKATGEGREVVTAAIFWLKPRAGWKETTSHEVSGKDGAPVAVEEVSNRQLAIAILAMIRNAEDDS
jgi:hypothetical protein